MNKSKIVSALIKSGRALFNSVPLIFGTVLLISLFIKLVPPSFYLKIFTNNVLFDSFIGSLVGSVSAGTPLTSYLIGGELLKGGVGLIAVTAFIVAWVTVGIVQLPAESMVLGKKFALIRNLLSFIFAIIVAILTVLILGAI